VIGAVGFGMALVGVPGLAEDGAGARSPTGKETRHMARGRFARASAATLFLLAAAAAPAADAGEALSPAQRKAVEDIVREFLRDNPEVVLEALQALRAKQADEGKQKLQDALAARRDDLENDAAAPVGGNPTGDVTVVEFFDYRCPYCKRMMPAIVELLKRDRNVRFVFKEFPILGPESVAAARAALAVWLADRSKYMSYHGALMESKGSLSAARLMDLAAGIGLDKAKLEKLMADPAIDDALRRNFALAESLQITGTPAFVVGREVVPGAIDLDTLLTLVARAREG
jgi:protein-disulfide isomerase